MTRLIDRLAPWLALVAAIALTLGCIATVSAADVEDDAPIVLPEVELPEPPRPPPDAVPVVKPGEMYVLTRAAGFALEAIPADAVDISMDTGPVKIRGVFAGDDGKRTSKTFNGFLGIVEPNAGASGRVTLRVWVNGKTAPSFTDYLIDIGVGPRPPPDPPKPTPPIPMPGKFKLLMLYESGDLPKMTAAQNSVLFSTAIHKYMETHGDKTGAAWRCLDKDADVSKLPQDWRDAITKAKTQPVPSFTIVTPPGTEPKVGPLPANEAEALKILEQVGGK